uniref:Uncharacterized protein n=1 Tax=Arundo donax TaxID=35708 RepID=A0A0A9GI84_ARUDO
MARQAWPAQADHLAPMMRFTAICRFRALSIMSKMHGHLPPSSSATGVRCLDAAAITTRAMRGLPVKRTLSHRCSISCSPTSGPPWTTFTAVASTYLPMLSPRNLAVPGDSSDGFRATAFPAAMAPISGSNDSPNGTFQQEKMRTTPSGSGTICPLAGNATSGTHTFSGAIHLPSSRSAPLADLTSSPTSSL